MAEIKSTMEMVLARAALMDSGPAPDLAAEELVKEGMRLGAAYLRREFDDLGKRLEARPPVEQPGLLQGVVKTMLRNIFLPRTNEYDSLEPAIKGLLDLSKGGGDLLPVFSEIKSIISRYVEHRNQLRKQLEGAFAKQVQQMQDNMARQTGMAMKIDPAHHPKFQEEWQRIQVELNNQYGRVLDQHKQLIEQRLTGQ
ncbi:MAG: hypothetical protein A2511_06970 [Deltaproteobacteria bacterium RIFOXYD12_FULL_50_9]|nr:MAG: hypothetical protein A2511_06970 [Deltaproteobacteria bacterium RIFOXYD12_FULL_50_9]